jgi:hypothetical protein
VGTRPDPTPKHSCTSEQVQQGHVPIRCGTPVLGGEHEQGVVAPAVPPGGVGRGQQRLEYNTTRLHSSIGHLPPNEFEQLHQQAKTTAASPEVA